MPETIQGWDFSTLDWIQAALRCPWLDWLLPKLTHLGSFPFIAVITILFLVLPSRRRLGTAMMGGELLGVLLGSGLLKHLVCRERPCWLREIPMLVDIPKDYSFPSGHSLAAFCAAVVLLHYDKRIGIPALAAAILVAFSRLYLYVHFPTDVLTGMTLGILVGIAAVHINEALWRRSEKAPS